MWVLAGYLLDSFEICTIAANFFLYFSFWLKIYYLPIFSKTFKSLADEPFEITGDYIYYYIIIYNI